MDGVRQKVGCGQSSLTGEGEELQSQWDPLRCLCGQSWVQGAEREIGLRAQVGQQDIPPGGDSITGAPQEMGPGRGVPQGLIGRAPARYAPAWEDWGQPGAYMWDEPQSRADDLIEQGREIPRAHDIVEARCGAMIAPREGHKNGVEAQGMQPVQRATPQGTVRQVGIGKQCGAQVSGPLVQVLWLGSRGDHHGDVVLRRRSSHGEPFTP